MAAQEFPSPSAVKHTIDLELMTKRRSEEELKALEVLQEAFERLEGVMELAQRIRSGSRKVLATELGTSEEEAEAKFDTEIIKAILGQETMDIIRRFADECIQYLGPDNPKPGDLFTVWALYRAPRIMMGRHEKYETEIEGKKYESIGPNIKWFADFERDETFYEDEEWIGNELAKDKMLADQFVKHMEKIVDQLQPAKGCLSVASDLEMGFPEVAEYLRKKKS